MPEVYAEFIPESDGSAVPRVEVMRGAAAVGEDRRSRLDETAQDFLIYAFAPSNPGGVAPGVLSNATIFASPLNFI